MRKTIGFKVGAVVLAVVFCAAPFILMRHVGRRLPENPILTETETVALQRETQANAAPDPQSSSAVRETQSAETAASPRQERQTTAQHDVQTPFAAVTRADPNGAVTVYGFPQNGRITGSRTAVSTTKPATADRSETLVEETTQPAKPPANDSPYTYVPPTSPAQDGEREDAQPKLVTDLAQYAVVQQGELTDDTLHFVAYGTDGENLSVQVRVKETNASGSPSLLQSSDGRNYAFPMTLGKTYTFYVTLLQNGVSISSPAVFSTAYKAALADRDTQHVGTGVSLYTNLDHLRNGDVTESASMALKVTARTVPDGAPIYADEVQVKLNGVVLLSVGGSTNPEYDLRFLPPDGGDTREYTIEVLAWHGDSSVYWWRTIQYRAVPDGTVIGTAHLSLDATTLGLDVLDEADVDIVQGETAAHAVLRFLEAFGYTCTYDGTERAGFYLRAVSRAGLCDGIAVPDDLKKMLQSDAYVLRETPTDPDTIGEHDFAIDSGWEYAINGVVYERGMSAMTLQDGDKLSLRFTLALGKDVGALPVDSSGSKLKSYCGIWADGTYTALPHVRSGEPTVTESGEVAYKCANCGQLFIPETEDDHENHAALALHLSVFLPAARRMFTRRVR